jgi:hypothetical protein
MYCRVYIGWGTDAIYPKGGLMARSSMMAALTAVAVGVVMVGGAGAQTFINGAMTDGYITTAGDTMPNGWGSTACNHGMCMRYDQQTYISAPASMRLEGTADSSNTWTQGVGGLSSIRGETITLTGQIKISAPTGTMRVAIVRACGGGGYGQLSYAQVVRDEFEGDWYQFTGTATVPTAQECAATPYANPLIIIHINPSGAGTVWIDDLVVTGPNTHIDLTDGFMLDSRSVRVEGTSVVFNGNANYDARLLTQDGRTVAHMVGEGTRIAGLGAGLPAGSYVLKVDSDHGTLTQTFTKAR